MIYLASPYSHPDEAVRHQRYKATCLATGKLLTQGHKVFSPIVHSHPIAMLADLPLGWDFWWEYDLAILEHADEIWVLMLDGWDTSRGVKAEVEYMTERGRPVRYIEATR